MNMQLNSIMMIWCNGDTFSITIWTHYSSFVFEKLHKIPSFRWSITFLAKHSTKWLSILAQESMIFPLRLLFFEIDLQFSCIHRAEWRNTWTTYLQTISYGTYSSQQTYRNEVISIVGTFFRILYMEMLFVSQQILTQKLQSTIFHSRCRYFRKTSHICTSPCIHYSVSFFFSSSE